MRSVLTMMSAAALPVIAGQKSLLPLAIVIGLLGGIKMAVDIWTRDKRRERRRKYYREDYLKSDNWKRKRALVLKRDGYKCVFCHSRATQVHHKNVPTVLRKLLQGFGSPSHGVFVAPLVSP